MLRSTSNRVRAGFTLIELLVVMAIIAVLVGLTTVGIWKVVSKGPDLADLDEIKQLEGAIGEFYAKYKVYPPDTVKLCHYEADYNKSDALDANSVRILRLIWPDLFKRAQSASAPPGFNIPIPWAGTGVTLPPHSATKQNCVVLQGDQCLVFFLGGPLGTQGFSESQTEPIKNPSLFPGKSAAIRFYEFPPSRLTAIKRSASTKYEPHMPIDQFPSFIDNWADALKPKPFVYFVGGNQIQIGAKGYNPLGQLGTPSMIGLTGDPGLDGVQPYFEGPAIKGVPTNYLNPSNFQIIGAGRDGKFGTIGQWKNGVSTVATNDDYKDNRANFHPNQLGVPR